MRRKLIHWLGLTGVLALFSYTAAVVFSPLAGWAKRLANMNGFSMSIFF